jgi:hypothetical protein
MTADEWKEAINVAQKGQCVIYDEAVTGMAAGDSITRIGKILKSMMMQMRQKNLFVIVIIPTIFEMGKYAVLSRARGLLRTYEKKGKMGYWVGYNKRDLKQLYILGKKTYSYKVRSSFIGRFYGKYTINEEAYRLKKSEALELVDDEGDKEKRGYNIPEIVHDLEKMGIKKRVDQAKQLIRWGVVGSERTFTRRLNGK